MSAYTTTVSDAKLQANRANAAHSTGPKTEEGKRLSSHNALKTGLTGRTVLLPDDDHAAYGAHVQRLETRYQPATEEEQSLVHTLADLQWRLLRIPTLESGLLALGRKRLAHLHPEEPAATRAILLEAEIQLEFQKPLANLALQEQRLTRRHERELAKLTALQTTRRQQEAAHLEEAARLYLDCQKRAEKFHFADLAGFGFEFSLEAIHRRAAQIQAQSDPTAWPTLHAHYLFHALHAA